MPFQPDALTPSTLKGFVDRLHRFSKTHQPESWPPKRSWAQEAVARALGFPHFHAAQQALSLPRQASADDQVVSKGVQWILPTPSGVAGISDHLLYPLESTRGLSALTLPVSTQENLLLLGTEHERDTALGSLVHATLPHRLPLLWFRGDESLPNDGHPLPAVRLPAFQGYGAAMEHVLHHWRAGEITELLASLLDDLPDQAMWKNRAIALAAAVVGALAHLRDRDGLTLTMDALRDALILDNLETLARRDLPANLAQSLRAYLRSLPGYAEGAAVAVQSDTTREQHGFLQMQFVRALGPGLSRFDLQPRLLVRLDREAPQPRALAALADEWAHRHPGGIILLDGMDSHSFAWDWFLRSSHRLKAQRHRVIVAAQTLKSLPDGTTAHRIVDRMDGWVAMGGARTATLDALELESLRLRSAHAAPQPRED